MRAVKMYSTIESPPVYCYTPQIEDVARLCRLIHVMTALHEVLTPGAIDTEHDFPHPIFIHVLNHPRPLPNEFFTFLRAHNAIIIALEFT